MLLSLSCHPELSPPLRLHQPISVTIPNISLATGPFRPAPAAPFLSSARFQTQTLQPAICHFSSQLMVLPSKIHEQILTLSWRNFAVGDIKAPPLMRNPVGLIYLLATHHTLQAYLFLTVPVQRSLHNSWCHLHSPKVLYLVVTCSQQLAGTSDTGDTSKAGVNGFGRGRTHRTLTSRINRTQTPPARTGFQNNHKRKHISAAEMLFCEVTGKRN